MTSIVALFAVSLVLLPAVMLARVFAVKKGWVAADRTFGRAGTFLPASAPPACGIARLVEATIIGAAAVVTLAVWHAVGEQPTFSMHPLVAQIAFVCVSIAGGVAVLATILGRTNVGVIVAMTSVAIYGLVEVGMAIDYRPMPPRTATPADGERVAFTIDLGETNAKGADLWVNGVYLGKTPYITTVADFEAKVPYWAKLPADLESAKVETPYYGPRGIGPEIRSRWSRFPRSSCTSQYGRIAPTESVDLSSSSTGHSQKDAATKTPEHQAHPGRGETAYYFAKVRYAGEWGEAGTGSGGGGSAGNGNWQIEAHFDVIFRQRQKRLDALLNMARAADYRVGPDWFQAAETYDGDAWLAVTKAAENEPGMATLRDAWAVWRYELDKAVDAESAWKAFQRICDEADSRQQYSTDSVTGRAVELLATKLPPERLVDVAVRLARETSTFSYTRWRSNGRLQFGCREKPGAMNTGAARATGYFGSSGNKSLFPVGGFPVAHAIWMLDEQLRSTEQREPNILQQRLVPEIVRWQYNHIDPLPMTLAAHLGGPAVDKFLLRQPWGTPLASSYYTDQTVYVASQQVNKWFYYLVYLNDDAGNIFRRTQAYHIMELADKICGDRIDYCHDEINFIFMDPDLAKEYWPRFSRLARQKDGYEGLRAQWEYLIRMGDAATVEMFVDTWKNTRLSHGAYWGATSKLDEIKPPLRRQVIDAIVRQVRRSTTNLAEAWNSLSGRTDAEKIDGVISMLESHDPTAVRLSQAEKLLADLRKEAAGEGRSQPLRQSVSLWLAHTQPDSPLVAMLAKADKPELRLMAMDALQAYPIPQYREMLDKLLKDADATVRTAAEKTSRQLKKLAAQDPALYASDASSPDAGSSSKSPLFVAPAAGEKK
jgi:hypothetical protein